MSMKLKKILVCTDFSASARQAVNYAVKLAETNAAKLVVLTVLPDLLLSDEELMMARVSVEKVKQESQEKIAEAHAQLVKQIRPAALKKLRPQFIVRDGKPFLEIVRTAKEVKADLIVVASHGQSRIAEMLLGSTTERVVQKAPCSVLVVREKQHEFKMP